MSSGLTFVEIADRARCIYGFYPAAAADLARHKIALQEWSNLDVAGRLGDHERQYLRDLTDAYKASAAGCLRQARGLGDLALAVAKCLPALWPQLQLVEVGARWHEAEGFDWDAGIAELRSIEAAALSAGAGEGHTKGDERRGQANIEAVERLLHLAGDGQAVQIMSVAKDDGRSANDRMYAIAQIDQRFEGFDSTKWGDLLDVKPGAVRQTEFWKTRKARRERA